MDLSNLKAAEGSVHSDNFRRGRGHGSGNGKTAGKGHKGQKARSGAPRPGFAGGQMPLYRRIPKRGFKNRNRLEIVAINISALEKFDNGADVTVDTLIESGIVKNPKDGVKILGNGELTKTPSMSFHKTPGLIWVFCEKIEVNENIKQINRVILMFLLF